MYRQAWIRQSVLTAGLVALVVAVGCVTVDWPDGNGGGGADPNKITVRLINGSSTLAVEPLLYATGQAVVDPDADLFVKANKVGGIGFAATGLIPHGQSETVELDCADARVLGTPGARFVDEDSGQRQGTGPQKLLSQDLQFQCGATITFTFKGKTGGDFETDLKISGP